MAITESFYGVGENGTNYVLDDVECDGHESSITECNHGGIGDHNCNEDEQAGAVCIGTVKCLNQIKYYFHGVSLCKSNFVFIESAYLTSVEIIGGSWSTQGQIKVEVDNTLSASICYNSYNSDERGHVQVAQVICRMLGFQLVLIKCYYIYCICLS